MILLLNLVAVEIQPICTPLENRCLCMLPESTEEHNVIYSCGQLQTVGESKKLAVIVDQVDAP